MAVKIKATIDPSKINVAELEQEVGKFTSIYENVIATDINRLTEEVVSLQVATDKGLFSLKPEEVAAMLNLTIEQLACELDK